MISRENLQLMAREYAAAEHARWLYENNPRDWIVVSRDYWPIRHMAVEEGGLEWATLDPWGRASYYAGYDDAKADIDATMIKPDVDLQPMSIARWYPAFIRIIERRLRAIENGAIVYDWSKVN